MVIMVMKQKSLINSIGSAFSSISNKLETNIGKVLEDPNKRALFYAGTEMIDKASRMVPLSSGKAQSPFGIITGSLGSGVKKVKAEEFWNYYHEALISKLWNKKSNRFIKIAI